MFPLFPENRKSIPKHFKGKQKKKKKAFQNGNPSDFTFSPH